MCRMIAMKKQTTVKWIWLDSIFLTATCFIAIISFLLIKCISKSLVLHVCDLAFRNFNNLVLLFFNSSHDIQPISG